MSAHNSQGSALCCCNFGRRSPPAWSISEPSLPSPDLLLAAPSPPSPGTPQPGGPPSSALAPQPQETPACLSPSISSPAAPGSRCAVSTGTCSLAHELIPRIQPLLTGRARGESSPEGSHSSVPATDFRLERGPRPRLPFMALLPNSQFSQKPGDGHPTFSSAFPAGRQLHFCEPARGCPPQT